MRNIKTVCFLLLLICNSIYFTAGAQDTVLHAVNDPQMMHYYTKHLFWIVLSLTIIVVLMYNGRRRKRKEAEDIADNKEDKSLLE